jgi:hypothetical protein
VRVTLAALAAALVALPAAAAAPRTWNTTLVGHLNPGGGFNGDISVHEETAYLGAWGFGSRCPVHGVRAIAAEVPSRPRLVSRFARFRGTTSEDVWVGTIRTPSFAGNLAAVGIQVCAKSHAGRMRRTFRGLALYDVSRRTRPRLLARLSTGRGTHGVHELSVVQRAGGRVLALLSVPHSLALTRKGDVRIVDVTNPRRPREVAHWDVRRSGPPAARRLARSRGFDELYAHSASTFEGGMKAFVSHWDAGEVFLDISNPARPRYLGRTRYPRGAYGNAHSAAFAPGERIFVQNDEVGAFGLRDGEPAWGFQRIFDASNRSRPVRLATFATENAVPGRDGRVRRDGFYSVHNNVFVGDVEVVSWYSDGVRVVNMVNPRRPRQIGYFVPPPRRDPQGFWRAPNGNRSFPLVWGVAVEDRLVYASDINSGLWIFRARGV